jgi:hypothetical protein
MDRDYDESGWRDGEMERCSKSDDGHMQRQGLWLM